MEWWNVAQPWVGIGTAVLVLIGTAASIGSLVSNGRRARREDAEKAAARLARGEAEAQLKQIIAEIGHATRATFELESRLYPGAKLGEERGLLVVRWNQGRLTVRMAMMSDQ